MSSKFKISVEIINDDGTKTIKPIIIEKDIPSIDDFMDGNNFRTNFDNYERSVLQARKEVIEIATEGYLEEASKKKFMNKEKNHKKRMK